MNLEEALSDMQWSNTKVTQTHTHTHTHAHQNRQSSINRKVLLIRTH
jgi:hypothetical protein